MYSLNSQNFSSNFFREMVENASKTKKRGKKELQFYQMSVKQLDK